MSNTFTSIENTDKTFKIINQQYLNIEEHSSNTQYQLLSKNDFGKKKNRINIGFFNKKTNIILSKDKSLTVFDKDLNKLTTISIPEIMENPTRYFLIYKYIFPDNLNNQTLLFDFHLENQTLEINLNLDFGIRLGTLLKVLSNEINTDPNFKLENLLKEIDENSAKIFKIILDINNYTNKINLNKNILLNSNPEFLLGILYGFFGRNQYFRIPKNINIYIFSTIFNLLGASYSIRNTKVPEDIQDKISFILRFKIPIFYKKYYNLEDLPIEWFRNYKYVFNKSKKLIFKKFKNHKHFINFSNNIKFKEEENFYSNINSGEYELISCDDIVFNKLDKSQNQEIIYDLIMENDNAHNYFIDGLPLLANSDGDIMAIFAVTTQEGSREVDEKLSPLNKLRFKNAANGEIFNYGILNDALTAVYAATKPLK